MAQTGVGAGRASTSPSLPTVSCRNGGCGELSGARLDLAGRRGSKGFGGAACGSSLGCGSKLPLEPGTLAGALSLPRRLGRALVWEPEDWVLSLALPVLPRLPPFLLRGHLSSSRTCPNPPASRGCGNTPWIMLLKERSRSQAGLRASKFCYGVTCSEFPTDRRPVRGGTGSELRDVDGAEGGLAGNPPLFLQPTHWPRPISEPQVPCCG